MPKMIMNWSGFDVGRLVQENGPFAAGVAVGWGISHWTYKALRDEWQLEREAVRKREEALQQQIERKEKRIDELHKRLRGPNGGGSGRSK